MTLAEAAAVASRRLNEADAAEYCGISPKTLEHYRRVGGGPIFMRPGNVSRRVVYDTADLDAWLAKGRRRSTSQGFAA